MVIIPVDTLLKEVHFEKEIMQYTNNEFIIELYDGEDELNISDSARMTLKVRKPDGTIACNYVQILDGNEAYVRWDEAKEVPVGEYVLEFTLHGGLSSMKLPPIYINIVENPNGKPDTLGLNAEYAVRGKYVPDGYYEFTFENYNNTLHKLITEDLYIDGLAVSPQVYKVVEPSEPACVKIQSDIIMTSEQDVNLKILYTTK